MELREILSLEQNMASEEIIQMIFTYCLYDNIVLERTCTTVSLFEIEDTILKVL